MTQRPASMSLRVALLAALVSSTACGSANLSGKWDGGITCGDAGSVDLAFDVSGGEGAKSYDAQGLLSDLTLDGAAAQVEIDSTWTPSQDAGPQVIDVDAACTVVYTDAGDTADMDCAGLDELGWDGADNIEAEIGDFLESGIGCTLELSRASGN